MSEHGWLYLYRLVPILTGTNARLWCKRDHGNACAGAAKTNGVRTWQRVYRERWRLECSVGREQEAVGGGRRVLADITISINVECPRIDPSQSSGSPGTTSLNRQSTSSLPLSPPLTPCTLCAQLATARVRISRVSKEPSKAQTNVH